MSLSDDTAQQTKSSVIFGIQQLEKLLSFLVRRYSSSNRLSRENLKQQKIEKKLKNKSGYIALKKLQLSKEKLRPLTIPLSDEQLKRFNYFAQKYGVIFSSVSNQSQEGIKNHHIIIKEKDLSLVKDITDRMNEEIRLKDYEDRINELEKMENRTPEEEKELKSLYEEKDAVLRDGTREFNNKNADIIFNDACGSMQSKSMDFDKVLNRFTDRDFSRDIPYYVCERTNPKSYIELKSTYSKFRGEQYTKTNYKVFNNGEEKLPNPTTKSDGSLVVNFSDERFEGRPTGYWQNLKNEMKEKGGFSNDMVIFNTKEEFERYQELYSKSIAEQNIEQGITNEEGYRDFSNIEEQLTKQLKSYNAELNKNGKAIDSNSKEILKLQNANSIEESLKISECIVISEQIANYEKINELQTRLAIDKQQLIVNEQGEKDLEKALQTERELNTKREKLSAEKAVKEVDKEYMIQHENKEIDINHEEETKDRDTQSMDEWKGQIAGDKQNIQTDNIVQDKTVTKAVSSHTKNER